VREQVEREFDEAFSVTARRAVRAPAQPRRAGIELEGLRGKNRSAIEQMAKRIRMERAEFERSLKKLQALRTVFGRHQQAIYGTVGVDHLKAHVREARNTMRSSKLSLGLRDGMASLLEAVRGDFASLGKAVDEVQTLMTAMYGSFNREHGLTLGAPLPFSVRVYQGELERIEALHQKHFGALSLVTTEKWALTRRFFESVAARIRDVYERAGPRHRGLAARGDRTDREPGARAPGPAAPPARRGAARDGRERAARGADRRAARAARAGRAAARTDAGGRRAGVDGAAPARDRGRRGRRGGAGRLSAAGGAARHRAGRRSPMTGPAAAPAAPRFADAPIASQRVRNRSMLSNATDSRAVVEGDGSDDALDLRARIHRSTRAGGASRQESGSPARCRVLRLRRRGERLGP
jgi:hypothetical protein